MNRNEHLTRSSDLIPEAVLGMPINIVGAGAVGGWVAMACAKMGFHDITVHDFDTVAIENVGCQIYGFSDIGKLKVEALGAHIKNLSGVQIKTSSEKYTGGIMKGVVISAVDSMAARRLIWEEHKEKAVQTSFIIDPRMGAETALLYTMRPMNMRDVESYEKCLYSDQDAVREPCTRKATSYCSLALAGLVASQVKAVATKQPYLRTTQWDMSTGSYQSWQEGKRETHLN
jgi:molybdopterin/thiamine biosynthesis adenylyltransferase